MSNGITRQPRMILSTQGLTSAGKTYFALFRCDVAVEHDAVGVPTVVWNRAGFYDWERPLPKHKPKGRRRATRDAVRATIGAGLLNPRSSRDLAGARAESDRLWYQRVGKARQRERRANVGN